MPAADADSRAGGRRLTLDALAAGTARRRRRTQAGNDLRAPDFAALAAFGAQVCVIGGGPVGIATALALARRGRRVLLLESGSRGPQPLAQALSRAEHIPTPTHHAPEITVARRLGGTSNLWGGRCLPFDPVDFRAGPGSGSGPGRSPEPPCAAGCGPPARCSPPATRSSRAAAGRRGRPRLRLREPGALEQPSRARRSCTGQRSARGPTSLSRSARLRSASSMTIAGGSKRSTCTSRDGAGPALGSACGAGRRRQREHPAAARRAAAAARALRRRGRAARALLHGPCQRPDRRRRPSTPAHCTTGSTSISTATAPTCGVVWCRAGDPGAGPTHQCRLLAGDARDRRPRHRWVCSRRSFSVYRSGRSGGG